MILNFNPALKNAEGEQIFAVEGFANGCFAENLTKGQECFLRLCNASGEKMCLVDVERQAELLVHRGVALDSHCCILMTPQDRAVDLKDQRELSYVGVVLSDTGLAMETGFDDFEVFANSWYALFKNRGGKLFNDAHQVIAEGFAEAKVFNIGYALRFEEKKARGDAWTLFSLSGAEVRKVKHVVAFLGDGNMLLIGRDNSLLLVDFNGKEIPTKPIACFEQSSDGCFVLTFSDGLSRLYAANGKTKSVEVSEATYMPDGCFVQRNGKLIQGIYRPDGIIDRRSLYTYEKTDGYYLLSGEYFDGDLYDANGQKIGENYVLVASAENFALFGHEGKLELFNQFGKVATYYEK